MRPVGLTVIFAIALREIRGLLSAELSALEVLVD